MVVAVVCSRSREGRRLQLSEAQEGAGFERHCEGVDGVRGWWRARMRLAMHREVLRQDKARIGDARLTFTLMPDKTNSHMGRGKEA